MSLLEEYKGTYEIETDPKCGFKVKIGSRMYLPGHFLSQWAAEKALLKHLFNKKKAASRRRKKKAD